MLRRTYKRELDLKENAQLSRLWSSNVISWSLNEKKHSWAFCNKQYAQPKMWHKGKQALNKKGEWLQWSWLLYTSILYRKM